MKNLLTFFLGLVIGIAGCYAFFNLKNTPTETESTPPALTEIQFSYGSEKAPVTVIEYSSSACGACTYFKETAWPELKKNYVDTGKVHWIVKPFGFAQPDLVAAHISYCHKKPNDMLETYYKTQQKWVTAQDPIQAIKEIALKNGMTQEELDHCLQDQSILNRLIMCRLSAATLDIEATPTFLIGNTQVSEALDAKEFSQILDQAVNHVKETKELASFRYMKNEPSQDKKQEITLSKEGKTLHLSTDKK